VDRALDRDALPPELQAFAAGYPFALDDYQLAGCRALAGGRSTLVCAPTGAGKTVVGEFAVWLALSAGLKAFYTTPLKALSNQKFGDFIARHGARAVGLLTGDNSINGEAPVVVMTTEVLRNMLYEGSPTLGGLGFVVMDEVHYLQDPYRGGVWEEVLIHLPAQVRVAALSATVSNAEEFGQWLRDVRGGVDVVIEDRRPVPLEHLMMVRDALHPTFVGAAGEAKPNPALRRLTEPPARRARGGGYRRGGDRRRLQPTRSDAVERLAEEGMLPAIYFIFSRAGCEGAVRQLLASHVRLTTREEAERIREYVELKAAVLPTEDLEVLGYAEWLDALTGGVASHHAGLIPLFKETVEELFQRGLVKVVFATETLSLGINVPAKTVVIERLVKFTGERHELMTPADYTQLTGRAGRRGIDAVGYAVVLYQRDVPFERTAALAGARTYQLASSFRPSYNMAVNLVRSYPVEEATRLLNLSFAQFLADRSVTKLQKQLERNERFIEGYRGKVVCHLGDFGEYWATARAARSAEREHAEWERRQRNEAVWHALRAFRLGEVILVGRGKRRRLAAVVEVRRGSRGSPVAMVVTGERRLERVGPRDFVEAPRVLGRVRLPGGDPRAVPYRREVARALESLEPGDGGGEPAGPPGPRRAEEERLRAHPCHGCPERAEHERWAERLDALEAETEAIRRRVRSRTESLARTFERVVEVLRAFGYVDASSLSAKGERLCRIYNEGDLLVAEALEHGIFEGLDVPDLAAVVSTLVYETRGFAREASWPTDRARSAFARVARLYREIRRAEDEHGIELCREPDRGFADAVWAWAKGEPLEEVLAMAEMSAGDFVRSTKQVWDLLRQLAEVAPSGDLTARFRDAARVIYRGVVAYSGAL
jgi:ATP-dependent RNA helicase HelY